MVHPSGGLQVATDADQHGADMPPKASKEELRARAEELNK